MFSDRVNGSSGMGRPWWTAPLRRLRGLTGEAVPADGAVRLALAGLIGMLVDFVAFQALFFLGAGLDGAQLSGFCLASLCNHALITRWAFPETAERPRPHRIERETRFLLVCLLALALRGGVLAGLAGLPGQRVIVSAIGATAITTFLGSACFVIPPANPPGSNAARWRLAAIGAVGFSVVLRLLFLGRVELMPQEAYYWDYARHLDIGYLDHPPMVAWLIWIGTSLFGNNEFGVRIAAWLCWGATAFFSFRLTRNLCGGPAAFVSLLLVAALPFYFATGLVMTPDAPLTACWAGTLYFLERALLGGERRAWWGVGLCIGLGLLSKYTIALLAPAALLFMLLEPRARVWFRRPEPYLAAALALVLFSPVILWNMEHGLASFAFQSTRRIEGAVRFSLPELLLGIVGLLTPTGLVAALTAPWLHARGVRPAGLDQGSGRDKGPARPGEPRRFIIIFTLVPLSVFAAFSLFHMTRLNWTGPLWLAVLPAVAAGIVSTDEHASAWQRRIQRAWAPTLSICLVLYGLGLNVLVAGLPGLGAVASLPKVPVAWDEFGRQAADIAREVRETTGQEPLLIGLDAYNIASELAFYGHDDATPRGNSVGRSVVGQPSLMYGFWYRPDTLAGRPAVLFAFTRHQIENPLLAGSFSDSGEARQQDVVKNGRVVGHFYYRVGYTLPRSAAQVATP